MEKKENAINGESAMSIDKKTQCCQDASSAQLDLQSQSNRNQNPNKLVYGY